MATIGLEIDHVTRYDYSQPVSAAQHLAILEPIDDGRQSLVSFDLHIDPPPNPVDSPPIQAQRRVRLDGQANRLSWFSLSTAHDHLEVWARSRIRLSPLPASGPWANPSATPSCAAVAQALRYAPRQAWQPAVEFTQRSPFVPRLPRLAEYGRSCLRGDRPVLEAALDLMQCIHRDFRYESRSTEIDTPLAQVLEQQSGVCQDFAHLMIGALRAAGLPARYVSGYLLTEAPKGHKPHVGADASHAWVQVWCPDEAGSPTGVWVDLDPTNNLVPDQCHVRLAIGRDFGDVTPLRGVIRGGGHHRLSVGVTTRRVCNGLEHVHAHKA